MLITAVVAMSENHVIGYKNTLPWHMPADLKHFKKITLDKPVLMGRKTHESIGKPLPGRCNIVITRDPDFRALGCVVVNSMDSALQAASYSEEVFIIGGAQIFQAAMPSADRIYLTLVHENFDGDAFFPEIKQEDWKLASNRDCEPDDKNAYALSFQVWERKPPSPEGEQ